MSDRSIFTKAVHAGEDHSEHYGAVSVPIYNASTFAFPDADQGKRVHNYEEKGYFYSRLGNPTQEALESAICELEYAEDALGFASGMAAITAGILAFVKTGGHIVFPESHYATTGSFAAHIERNFGISSSFIDAQEAKNYERAIRENTKLLYIETPANPTLKVTGLDAVAKIGKKHGIATMADNTFASPFNQNPLKHGIGLVAHSATKYLGGHSDLTAGILAGSKEIIDNIRHSQIKLFGGNISPQTAWLLLRGIKTLALRMERHNENASAIADILFQHPKVKAVYYPGLPSHQGHETAKGQMRGFGGMIAFDIGGIEEGKKLLNNLRLCAIATSLGGVETIMQHSASMTNANQAREERLKAGITDGLIRLSVGIEDKNDIIADLQQALDKI